MLDVSDQKHHPRDYPQGAVVAVVYQASKFLTIKRSQHVKAPGAICFAGGGVEPNEVPRDAVIREMKEELNINVVPQKHVWTGTTPSGIDLAFWHVALDPAQSIVPNPEEVEAYFWMSPEEMRRHPDLLSSAIEFLDRWDAGEIEL